MQVRVKLSRGSKRDSKITKELRSGRESICLRNIRGNADRGAANLIRQSELVAQALIESESIRQNG
jgi:hypothetical protein